MLYELFVHRSKDRPHLLSIILTLTPALASAFDAKSPAGPAPIMRTSALVSLISTVGMLTIRKKRMKRAAWVVFIYFRIGPYRIKDPTESIMES